MIAYRPGPEGQCVYKAGDDDIRHLIPDWVGDFHKRGVIHILCEVNGEVGIRNLPRQAKTGQDRPSSGWR